MTNFTSSLPDKTLAKLAEMASRFRVPKNQIIERALNKYLFELERQMFIKGFKQIAYDKEAIELAEEGMTDYLSDLEEWDEKG